MHINLSYMALSLKIPETITYLNSIQEICGYLHGPSGHVLQELVLLLLVGVVGGCRGGCCCAGLVAGFSQVH